jgi:hypothetical protein
LNVLPKKLKNNTSKDVDENKSLLDKKVGEDVPSACDKITMKPSNSLICQTQKKLRNRGLWILVGQFHSPFYIDKTLNGYKILTMTKSLLLKLVYKIKIKTSSDCLSNIGTVRRKEEQSGIDKISDRQN